MQRDFLELTMRFPSEDLVAVDELVAMHGSIGSEVVSPDVLQDYLETKPEWELVDRDELEAVEEAAGAVAGTVLLKVYFSADDEGRRERKRLIDQLQKAEYDVEILSETNVSNDHWDVAWRQFYKPLEIGNVIVVPAWQEVPDDGRLQVRIDPGMAFGTGSHETTALVIDLLSDAALAGKRALDLGCGSGILSILLKERGASEVVAADIDEDAIAATEQNAALNDVSFAVLQSDLFSEIEGRFDVICANLLAELVVRMLDEVDDYLTADGVLFLSGILAEKRAMVEDKLNKEGFVVDRTLQKGDWVAMQAHRTPLEME